MRPDNNKSTNPKPLKTLKRDARANQAIKKSKALDVDHLALKDGNVKLQGEPPWLNLVISKSMTTSALVPFFYRYFSNRWASSIC